VTVKLLTGVTPNIWFLFQLQT